MNTVKAQYTVKLEYVDTNKKNIAWMMEVLREMNNSDLKYSAFLLDHRQTFIHFVMRANEKAHRCTHKVLICMTSSRARWLGGRLRQA